jgi:hypothetical protein
MKVIIVFLIKSNMENSAIDSSEEENQYLKMIIENDLKKSNSSQKEKADKGNYKFNLSADLMRNGSKTQLKCR